VVITIAIVPEDVVKALRAKYENRRYTISEYQVREYRLKESSKVEVTWYWMKQSKDNPNNYVLFHLKSFEDNHRPSELWHLEINLTPLEYRYLPFITPIIIMYNDHCFLAEEYLRFDHVFPEGYFGDVDDEIDYEDFIRRENFEALKRVFPTLIVYFLEPACRVIDRYNECFFRSLGAKAHFPIAGCKLFIDLEFRHGGRDDLALRGIELFVDMLVEIYEEQRRLEGEDWYRRLKEEEERMVEERRRREEWLKINRSFLESLGVKVEKPSEGVDLALDP